MVSVIRKEIAYLDDLPIRPWPFAFNRILWPCDSSQRRPYGPTRNQKKIAYNSNLQIRPWPFAFNQQIWPCGLNQIRPYGLKSKQEKNAYRNNRQIRPYGLLLSMSFFYGLVTRVK